jgi:tetratricopeptide (TPR) repeat protein
MSNSYIAWISGLVFLSTSMPVMAITPAYPKTVGIEGVAQAAPEETLEQIAQRATVRIVTGQNKGSGTIISKRDNIYLILTNNHVVRGSQSIQVQTFDGQTYSALVVPNAFAKEQDLALLEIISSKSYSVPELADFSPLVESETLSAGYEARSGKFQTSEGKVRQLPGQPLKEGYQLGYSGKVEQGMSGGPVFDGANYNLIGINGQTAFPLVSSYVYEDGSKPSAAEVQQMRQVNWSIPIRMVLAQVRPKFLTAYNLPLPESDPGVKTTKLPQWMAEIEAKAKQFTVRIDSISGKNGSGVIVAREGNTYTVLTAEHVICERAKATEPCGEYSYKIATHDGKTYALNKSRFRSEIGVDLGVVEFQSETVYPVATLANYNTSKSDYVFVAGFPKVRSNAAPQWLFSGGGIYEKEQGRFSVTNSRLVSSSGIRAGLIQSQASFADGYDLVYTSITYGGMSGGAVLDSQGRVIGIHGLAEAESVISEVSKTDPAKTVQIAIQLGNSLGIPIGTFIGIVPRFKLSAQQLSLATGKPNALSPVQQEELIDVTIVSKGNAKPSIRIERGNQLLRLNRDKEAEEEFDHAIALNPSFVHLAWYGKGTALAEQGNFPEAIRAFEASLKKKPDYPPAFSKLSAVYRELKDYKNALATIKNAIKLTPRNANFYNEKWNILVQLKRNSEALSTINEAIVLSPRAAFYTNRGNTYDDLKDYAKAITDYTKAIAINPESLEAYFNRGIIYAALKDYAKAIADYTKAIAINPEDSGVYNNRGSAYDDLKDYAKAIADYTKAIAINPEYAKAYFNRGITYAALKDYAKAITDYTKAIAINPKDADTYYSRGITYAALKDYAKAIADYTKAIAINPEYAKAYFNRGSAYDDLKDYASEIADYTKAIAIDPKDADTYFNRGITYAALKDYAKAIADYAKAIAINPKAVEAINNIGLLQYEQGNIDIAINQFQQAVNIDNTLAESTLALAITLQAKGNFTKAEELARAALALDPKIADPAFLRENLWGEKLIADAQTLLNRFNKKHSNAIGQ